MENTYRHTKTTVSLINYHFIFCPRYRRKIFNIPGVEQRFKDLVYEVCEPNHIDILAMECHVDHVHMFVSAMPDTSAAEIMRLIKVTTSPVLRTEFFQLSAMPNIWTRNYFVSTASEISDEIIKSYVETQKTRP